MQVGDLYQDRVFPEVYLRIASIENTDRFIYVSEYSFQDDDWKQSYEIHPSTIKKFYMPVTIEAFNMTRIRKLLCE